MALYDESGGIENTGIRRQVIKEITDFAKKYDVKNSSLRIKARGDFKRTSDIDLAVSDGKFDRFALH